MLGRPTGLQLSQKGLSLPPPASDPQHGARAEASCERQGKRAHWYRSMFLINILGQ